VTSYVKPMIDQWWGKYSERQRQKNRVKQDKFNERVELLLKDPVEVAEVMIKLFEARLLIFIALIVAAATMRISPSLDKESATGLFLVVILFFTSFSLILKYLPLELEYKRRKGVPYN